MRTIVSLTSHQPRFSMLHHCLQSLYSQTGKVHKIILYLDKGVKHEQLTRETLYFQDKGLDIIITDKFLGPHAKYYFAMQQYPDDIIITVDDDVRYDSMLIDKLMHSYYRFPMAVSAMRTHKMVLQDNGKIKNYANWDFEYTKILVPSFQLFATGVGGVLYPPGCMCREVFNESVLMGFCLYADDIWLKIMQLISGTQTVYVDGMSFPIKTIEYTQDCALYKYNLHGGGNDVCINRLIEYYDINLKKLFSEEVQ